MKALPGLAGAAVVVFVCAGRSADAADRPGPANLAGGIAPGGRKVERVRPGWEPARSVP
jgi:hypothetical protein